MGPAAPAVAVPAETPGIPVETPPVATPDETVPAETGNAVQEGPQIPEDASLEAGP